MEIRVDHQDQAKLKLIGENFGGTILHQLFHIRDGAQKIFVGLISFISK